MLLGEYAQRAGEVINDMIKQVNEPEAATRSLEGHTNMGGLWNSSGEKQSLRKPVNATPYFLQALLFDASAANSQSSNNLANYLGEKAL